MWHDLNGVLNCRAGAKSKQKVWLLDNMIAKDVTKRCKSITNWNRFNNLSLQNDIINIKVNYQEMKPNFAIFCPHKWSFLRFFIFFIYYYLFVVTYYSFWT